MDYKSNKDLNAMNEQIPNRSISNKKREELTKNIGLEFQDIQIRTLTKWIQVQLKEPINNITQDFRDGKKLLALLQAVSTTTKTLKPEKGHMRIHELSNVAQALKFLQDQWGADNLPAIGSEAIVNGDTKSTLAILFFIMIKYQVHPIINHFNKLNVPIIPLPTNSTSSLQQNNHSSIMTEAKLALLYWVQCQLDDYVQYQIISCIQDFSRSWRSGLAFCLLIHRYDPDMIPTLFHQHHSIHHDKSNWFTLLSLAFDIAEKQLGVPKYLEPQDLLQVEYPHEPSVMVYVSAFYHVMSLKEEDSHREKRLHDISLVTMSTTTMLDSSASLSNLLDSSTTTTTTTQEEDEEEQLPSTPQPEELFHKEDVYQHLNTLSDLLKQQDKVQSRQLLDNTNKLIMQLPPNSQQMFMNRYNQLKSEWELISSKKTPEQVQQHPSLYVNESNPLVKMISEIHGSISAQLHPLDSDLADTEEFDSSLKHVATLIQVDHITDTDTIVYFQATEQACHLMKRGLTFKHITRAIHNELESIQQWMSSKDQGTTVTHSMIQQLEQRIHVVNATIQGVREEYTDVLLYDTSDYYNRYTSAIDSIEDQYETVRNWIDQVRVWFLEAERIRAWIDQHIGILEQLEEIRPVERDLTVSDTKAVQLFEDHERLKSEIDHFDGDDMNRLRAHVKMLTLETHQELTPADTSTIEITLTTLNMLNQLTQSLNKRSHLIQLLVNRVKWEDLFGRAVQWIASTDQQLDLFLRDARWKEVQSLDIEDIINMLVNLEHRIADFDRGDYTQVLDAYQDMESLETLPDYLEVRQIGFEHCFEDLMKRSGFSRLIVEQLLSMMSTIDKFKQLRNTGEQLRQTLLNDTHNHDDEDYAEQVQSFKEDSAKLITSSTTMPYPEAPAMQTAIGSHDRQENLVTNENIKSTLSAYSMSLALIADGLDQLLNSRYQLSSLQQRVTEALEAMARSMSWMNERIKLLQRHLVSIQDDDAIIRLEKERDAIALRLSQTDDAKLFELVQNLEYDIDRANNAVSIDRDLLITRVEELAATHQLLQDLLLQRSVDLEKLKKKMEWESQWNKTNSHVQTLARKLCDFNVKKARYDPTKEEKPNYAHDHENRQALQLLQDRIQELGDRHVSLLIDLFDGIENETKQEDLLRDYEDLKYLASYTVDLMTQRATVTEFLLRSIDLMSDGEKIKEAITKRTRSTVIQEESTTLEDRTNKLKAEIARLWQECGNTVSYSVYNGQWLKSSDSGPYRSQVRAQIKAMLDKKMQDLNSLTASLDQLLSAYHEADRLKLLVAQYEQEARDLATWIDEQMDSLQQHHLDVSAEAWPLDLDLKQLISLHTDTLNQVDQFEQDKVKLIHDQLAKLVQDAVDKKKRSTVNVSTAARQLGQVMDHLSQLKRALADHAITLEAATKRAEWETSLQVGLSKLQVMHDQLAQFTTKKNQWMALEDVTDQQVSELQHDLQRLTCQRQHFANSVLPGIQLSYDAFVEYFPKLPRPMATPDHLEARMESLSRTAQRFEEHVAARSKELELIKQRLRWEDAVKQALVYLSSKECSLEQFIERARWHYTVVDSDDEIELRTSWASLSQDITDYQHDVITPLQHTFDALVSETADHTVTLPISVAKKMQDVQEAQRRADQYLDFSNQVVSQRCLVAAFILRTAQLEQSAELIREEFIANTQQLGGSEMAGLFETHTQRLAKFKDGVTDVRENLANSIPYPVRTKPLVANTRDESTHAVIKETVEMRNARLDEIYVGLQQLLISKERVSRKRLSLHAYQKQAALVSQWIEQRRSLLSETVDLAKLKEAVSQAESVEQAMKVQDNVYTLLVAEFDKCIQAFEQPSKQEEQHVDSSEVKPTQEKITQEWNALLQQATEANAYRTALLIKQKVLAWVFKVDSLFVQVTQDSDEEHVALWMTECDQLEQASTTLTLEITDDLQPMLNNGHIQLLDIKRICLDLQQALYLHQLIQSYSKDVTALQSLINSHTTLLTKINEQYKCIDSESSADSRALQHQQLVSAFKQVTDNMTDLQDTQENIVAQYKVILAIDSSYKSNQGLNKQWQQAQELQAMVSSLVARSAKWVIYFNALATIRSQLESIDLDNQEQYAVHIEQLDLIDLSSHLVKELVQDKVNSEPYERQRLACLALKEQLKFDLQQRIASQARSALLSTVQQMVDTLCGQCNAQLMLANNHTVDFLSPATPCNDLMKSAESVIKDVQQELEQLQAQQCDQLLKLDCSQEQVDAIISPASYLLTKLQDVISTENQHLESAQLLNKFKTLESSLLETLNQGIQAFTGHCVETLVTLWESQLESIDQSKFELGTLAQQIDQSNTGVQRKYDIFISQLQQARAGLEKNKHRTSIIDKLNDFIAYIASMTDHVNSLHLNDKSSVSVAEERELQDICQDFTITSDKKTIAFNSLLNSYNDKDDTEIKTLRQQLSQDMTAFKLLLTIKQKQAADHGDLSHFSSLMSQFDHHTFLLTTAISNASPHHSSMLQGKFVKSDLQALLKSLIGSYKEAQQAISSILPKARQESNLHLSETADDMIKANKRWNALQASAAARERELQTCIQHLDHEFFTNLALAKTKSRHYASLPKERLPMNAVMPTFSPRRSFDDSSSSSTKKRPFLMSASSSTSRMSRYTSSYIPDPRSELDIELGKIVNAYPYRVHVRVVPDQVGKYWFGDENPKLVYCRILPSQLVMVRVGGGWVELSKFLREHGLTEGAYSRPISQQDYSPPFQESYVTLRSTSPSARITIRGGNGANGLSSRSSSRSTTGSRSRSPLPGFVEGDKFIMDEAGNSLVIKMKKADQHAKTPIINKKKK